MNRRRERVGKMKRSVVQDGLRWEDENGTLLFSIREIISGDTANIGLGGNMSSVVAPAFEDELVAAASVCSKIVVDFRDLETISSGGLKALLTAQRLLDQRPGGMLKLREMKPSLYATFAEIGFDELFEIEN